MPINALVLAALMLAAPPASGSAERPPVRVDPPAKLGSMAPNLAVDGASVILSWLEPPHPGVKPQDGNYALRMARLSNGRWSTPVTIAASRDIFANWADFPSVTADGGGRLLAHWAAKSSGDPYAYDVRLARSTDGGRTWIPMGSANDDRTPTEHGFVSAVPEAGGGFRVFWLDGRETAGGRGAMALRTALVGDSVGRSSVLDAKVCDCCQTAAAAVRGGAAVVYRDRSDREIRDVSIIRKAGKAWTPARAVHDDGWEIDGCPVNGPAIAAEGDSVAVTWFTQERGRASVKVTFSKDRGASFGAPVTIDAAAPLGRVDVALDANGDALVTWVASERNGAAIRVARVSPSGRLGPAVTVSRTDASRSSGFPRLERTGSSLVVAWTEATDPFRLRAAILATASVR